MVDSQELNGGEFNEDKEVQSDEEMFPLTGNSQQFELKDLDSQTIELFNSQTYADDANKVLNNNDFATHSEGFELPVSLKSLENLEPGQTIDMEVYTGHVDNKPTFARLEHLKQFPSIDAMLVPWINFQVSLPSEASDKTSWMYSEILRKLFVKMGNTCTFNVSLAAASDVATIVRVMVVCSAPEDLHNPVSRCDNHRCSDKSDILDDIKTHVVRCKNEQVSYVGIKEGKIFEERLAVLVPLGHSNKTGITLEFVCQNSCRNINRRATALVFTLENEAGEILGRQTFQIKICTNIKRDKLNEEKAEMEETIRKRKAARPLEMRRGKKHMRYHSTSRQQHPGLQIKEESGTRRCEIEPVTLQVTLPNRRIAKRMLENAIGHVSTAIVKTSSETERSQLMQYVQDIRRTKSSFAFVNSQSSVDSD
ncbi:cellular tumor antigen p53-like isoform X2 [Topomyia yanbarensis]|uniref:cellular tumor antigen p53-like isoform X2 n=1 Tax=Topomyia yanbarensis TaxID=2498891 RepID=UPI00273B6135|nr:cellular tumor antigen p53-like isoform X2 [Topomyia yanbarensis]